MSVQSVFLFLNHFSAISMKTAELYNVITGGNGILCSCENVQVHGSQEDQMRNDMKINRNAKGCRHKEWGKIIISK